MDYFEKIDHLTEDLAWNIPEKKQGSINLIGGSSGSFKTEVKVAEFLSEKYPLENVNLVLPDALRGQLPDLPNFIFLPSTDSGSLDESQALVDVFNQANFNLVLGDLSKNSITGKAVTSACKSSEKPLLITRDSVDLMAENQPERGLANESLILMGSLAQLQKILRVVYYPKMLLLAQSLFQVGEVLHKFTLSYPVKIITLHNEQILVAENGAVKAVPLAKSGYQPFALWQGELAAKITVLNLYNPNRFVDATVSAIFS